MKIKVKQTTEVEITPQEVFNILVKKLGVEDFKIVDGKLCELSRSGWDDYDYEPVNDHPRKDLLIKRLEVLDELKVQINKTINPYAEKEIC